MPGAGGGEEEPGFCEARHVAFIRGLMDKSDTFEHVVMEHLKVGLSLLPQAASTLIA